MITEVHIVREGNGAYKPVCERWRIFFSFMIEVKWFQRYD